MKTTEKKPSRIIGGLKAVTSYEQVKDGAVMIYSMLKALDPRNIKAGRVETFDEARTRLKVNNNELEATRLNHGRIFYIASLFIVLAWGLRIEYGFTFLGTILTLSFTAMCGSLMFRHSFRASQIKAKKLHSVKEWLNNPSFWLPDAF